MSIGVIVDFEFKPGGAAATIEGMRQALPHVRTEEGCEMVELYVDHDNANHLILSQRWTTRAQYDEHMKRVMAQPGEDKFAELLARDMTITYLDETGA